MKKHALAGFIPCILAAIGLAAFAFVPVFPVRISRVLVVFPQLSIQVNAVLDREFYPEESHNNI